MKIEEYITSLFIIFIDRIKLLVYPIYQGCLVKIYRYKKKINVIFFASSVSMWRYQGLYESMIKHPKFNVSIIIHPALAYSDAQQKADVNGLIDYFVSRNMPYMLAKASDGRYINIRKELSPDILFYPQPYSTFYPSELSFTCFYDKLLCYYPYAFWTSQGRWSYNQPLHKAAWKLFYPTMLHKYDAQLFSDRKGENMEIVGYPTSDDFLKGSYEDVWKMQSVRKKRVIWAPHFTVFSTGYLQQSTFLETAEFMLDLAQMYQDKVQFAFKPHPRLFSELCQCPEWGEERTQKYYSKWSTLDNTQLETGEFVDLFMTSDAMIHDCGSFSVEYHYSCNPVMFLAKDFDDELATKNEFGKLAMNLHYIGKSANDIINFIEDVVLNGNDYMKPYRKQFLQDYLVPPNGRSVAENTMEIFLKEFC